MGRLAAHCKLYFLLKGTCLFYFTVVPHCILNFYSTEMDPAASRCGLSDSTRQPHSEKTGKHWELQSVPLYPISSQIPFYLPFLVAFCFVLFGPCLGSSKLERTEFSQTFAYCGLDGNGRDFLKKCKWVILVHAARADILHSEGSEIKITRHVTPVVQQTGTHCSYQWCACVTGSALPLSGSTVRLSECSEACLCLPVFRVADQHLSLVLSMRTRTRTRARAHEPWIINAGILSGV